MKFGQFILSKTIKIVASRCQILSLKCTKFDFGWGSAPDPTGGAYSAPPDPLAGCKGPTSKGREGEGEDGSQSHPPLKYLRSATETVLLKLNKTLDVQF